jgi:hypothetical protein
MVKVIGRIQLGFVSSLAMTGARQTVRLATTALKHV